jgi:hypothetical protein
VGILQFRGVRGCQVAGLESNDKVHQYVAPEKGQTPTIRPTAIWFRWAARGHGVRLVVGIRREGLFSEYVPCPLRLGASPERRCPRGAKWGGPMATAA